MTELDSEQTKAMLRTEARERRASMRPAQRQEASLFAVRHFLDAALLGPGDIVAGYWPIHDELDVKPLVARLMDSGQPVCLPVMMGEDAPLELRLWSPSAPLYPAGYGTLAPETGAPVVEPDVILVPLLGFDRQGTRLGYGGGYYDRTLAALGKSPRLIGVAFGVQEFEAIPREAHDVPLDAIVTENGVRLFAGRSAAS